MNNELTELDMKALRFRDELIELCKKYDCNIENDEDDVDMVLSVWINKDFQEYSLTNNLDIAKNNGDNLIDILIRRCFNHDSGEMYGLNNIKVYCGVISNDWDKAHSKFIELIEKHENEIKHLHVNKNNMELILENDDRYLWKKPTLTNRCYRFSKAIIDKNLTMKELQELVFPICYACGRDDIEIF